jgi:hypothetical protein
MKVRCKACGQVSKIGRGAEHALCPACGEQLLAGVEHVGTQAPVPSGQGPNTGKGQLVTHDTAARNVGCLIMGILILGASVVIAGITGGDEQATWVFAIVAVIALIPLGVWFERKTIKRRQK